MEPPEKILWLPLKLKKRSKFYKLGIICGILYLDLDYLKMRVKKVNISHDIALKNFDSIERISFDLQNLTFR